MNNQELKFNVLKILDKKPDLTQRQLSQKLGISLGKTHYLVRSLIDVGWVKISNFKRSNNKIGYAYLLTPKGIIEKAAITSDFLVRKQLEYENLRDEIRQLQQDINLQKIDEKTLK
ncbi:MarR family EPS-associated transcriptional regulator [Woeseiaceae bacterium]|nr:MarR family EPS-associated transcriptional regulator [Woeseiaceae bacterium]